MNSRTRSRQGKKACIECRQQKARCDSHLDPTKPCSRCQKLNIRCVISDPFKREHKRQKLSELQQQSEELRHQLRESSHRAVAPSPISLLYAAAELSAAEAANTDSQADVTSGTPKSIPLDRSHGPTLSRTIEGQQVEASEIDGLFQLYFRDYSKFMPFLDPEITPNAYYALSPFLFWAIAGVACRTYYQNPMLLGVLPTRVIHLALVSLKANLNLYSVQGLLLVLNWPFPKTHSYTETTFPLSGAVLHMAMQIGLHIPLSSQDWGRVELRLAEGSIDTRAQVWSSCMLVYQRLCLSKGYSPVALSNIAQDREQKETLAKMIPPKLKFELKLQDIATRCCRAISQNGLRVLSADQERSLDILLHVFEAQIEDVEFEPTSDLDRLYFSVARLHIQNFHLYKSRPAKEPTSLTDLFTSACQTLEYLDALDRSGQIVLAASPTYLVYGVMNASYTLLRLLKTSFSRYINIERARLSLFSGVNISKRMSLESNDIPARNAAIIMQLWNSEKVFKNPDGTESTDVRLRSRLAMGPSLDTIGWWREEFGGLPGNLSPPPSELRTDARPAKWSATAPSTFIPESSSSALGLQDMSPFLGDPLLAEFGWPAGDNIFFTHRAGFDAASPWPSMVDGAPFYA